MGDLVPFRYLIPYSEHFVFYSFECHPVATQLFRMRRSSGEVTAPQINSNIYLVVMGCRVTHARPTDVSVTRMRA